MSKLEHIKKIFSVKDNIYTVNMFDAVMTIDPGCQTYNELNNGDIRVQFITNCFTPEKSKYAIHQNFRFTCSFHKKMIISIKNFHLTVRDKEIQLKMDKIYNLVYEDEKAFGFDLRNIGNIKNQETLGYFEKNDPPIYELLDKLKKQKQEFLFENGKKTIEAILTTNGVKKEDYSVIY